MQKIVEAKANNRGFTIVELLVVIVVIGILAAITIVSYTGVTTRAKNTQAQANAESVQNVAEAMNAENGHYPRLTTDLVAGSLSTHLPSSISLTNVATTPDSTKNATPSAANGQGTVLYQYCGAIAAPAAGAELGGKIQVWDFQTNALSTTVTYVGSGVSGAGTANCNTFVTPAT